MSKAMNMNLNMLRTRRKDNNVKPNRRLDRKSSRGMIYENEELRLKTININAEIERGQSDIKKLKRENDMLKKEIWCLRDEYEKLDKLLKEKDIDFSVSSSTTCTSDSESTSSYTEESIEVETTQNMENVHKTNNMNSLQSNFDLLSIVPEENSTDYNSEKLSTDREVIIKADQCYPPTVGSPPHMTHFFSPLPSLKQHQNQLDLCSPYKSAADLLLKTDNNTFRQIDNVSYKTAAASSGSFSNGGNLEELLNDIENISHDILQLSNSSVNKLLHPDDPNSQLPVIATVDSDHVQTASSEDNKEYKSELSVVLMPKPMPLIGFEKYRLLQRSAEHVGTPGFGLQDPWSSGHHRSCDNVQQVGTMIGFGGATYTHADSICTPSASNNRLSEHMLGDFNLLESNTPYTQNTASRDNLAGSSGHLHQTQVPPQIPNLPVNTTESSPLCNGDVKHTPTHNFHQENEERLQFRASSNGNLTTTNQALEQTLTPGGNQQQQQQQQHKHLHQPLQRTDSSGASRLSGIRKKVSIHFRGRKERDKAKKEKQQQQQQQTDVTGVPETNNNSGSGNSNALVDVSGQTAVVNGGNRLTVDGTSVGGAIDGIKSNGLIPSPSNTALQPNTTTATTPRVSISASPERRKQQQQQQQQQSRDRNNKHRRRQSHHRRSSAVSGQLSFTHPQHLERSYSVCSSPHNNNNNNNNHNAQHHRDRGDRHQNNLDELLLYSMTGLGGSRSSSASSVSGRSVRLRRLSSNGTGAVNGKLPWCACWGNGCL